MKLPRNVMKGMWIWVYLTQNCVHAWSDTIGLGRWDLIWRGGFVCVVWHGSGVRAHAVWHTRRHSRSLVHLKRTVLLFHGRHFSTCLIYLETCSLRASVLEEMRSKLSVECLSLERCWRKWGRAGFSASLCHTALKQIRQGCIMLHNVTSGCVSLYTVESHQRLQLTILRQSLRGLEKSRLSVTQKLWAVSLLEWCWHWLHFLANLEGN